MLLCVDAGNNELKAGLFEGDELVHTIRLSTDVRLPGAELAARLRAVFGLSGFSAAADEGAVYASVVPGLHASIREALGLLCGSEPLCVGPGVKTGLDIRVDNPLSMGTDFVCCAVGALARHTPPLAVFDLGTASTAMVLDREGVFIGKTILCGVGLGVTALHEHTAVLPEIELRAPAKLLGRSTGEAMLSGAVYGAAAAVDGFFAHFEAAYGPDLTGILTGGYCGLIAPFCARQLRQEPHLSLYGLRQIFLKNRHPLQ